MGATVVLSTVGTEEQANDIACELVERGLAACVNIVPRVRSVYRWHGEICQDDELLLVIKACATRFEEIAAAITELHDYDLPEILSFAVSDGAPGFLDWIEHCSGAGTTGDGTPAGS